MNVISINSVYDTPSDHNLFLSFWKKYYFESRSEALPGPRGPQMAFVTSAMRRKPLPIEKLKEFFLKYNCHLVLNQVYNIGHDYGTPEDTKIDWQVSGTIAFSNLEMFVVIGTNETEDEDSKDNFYSNIMVHGVNTEMSKVLIADFLANTEPYPAYKSEGKVYMLMTNSNGRLEFKSLPKRVDSPLIRDNYSPEVVSGYDRITGDLTGKVPHGRIGIFDGPPGTGKTHLVESLITGNEDVNFVFVPPYTITGLTEPSGLPALIDFSASNDNKPIVLVCEDADEIIAPRDAGNISYVSQVLNLGDGILGKLLDIRLILTTNAKRQHFDSAITRPGRLSSIVKVGNLSAEQANEIYKRLTGKEGTFESDKSLAQVYSAASDAGWKAPVIETSRPMGFVKPSTPPPY